MALTSQQGLAVAILIYFVPALPISIFICFRLGIGRVWGWACLTFFCTLRIAGAVLRIAADNQPRRNPDQGRSGLDVAAQSLANLALMPLLLVMLELLTRIKQQLQARDPKSRSWNMHWFNSTNPFIERAWFYIPIAQTAEFILGIVAFSINSTSLRKAVFIITAVIFTLQAYIAVVYFFERHNYDGRDHQTPLFAILSAPFLTLRVVYGVGHAFNSGDWLGIVGSVVMVFVMEAIVVAVYLFAATKMEPGMKKGNQELRERETGSP